MSLFNISGSMSRQFPSIVEVNLSPELKATFEEEEDEQAVTEFNESQRTDHLPREGDFHELPPEVPEPIEIREQYISNNTMTNLADYVYELFRTGYTFPANQVIVPMYSDQSYQAVLTWLSLDKYGNSRLTFLKAVCSAIQVPIPYDWETLKIQPLESLPWQKGNGERLLNPLASDFVPVDDITTKWDYNLPAGICLVYKDNTISPDIIGNAPCGTYADNGRQEGDSDYWYDHIRTYHNNYAGWVDLRPLLQNLSKE